MKIPHLGVAASRLQTPPAQPTPNAPADAKPAQTSAAASTAAPSGGLSADEQRMIDRYFPPAPELTQRLYGPDREAHAVQPDAIGGRLDLHA